MSQFHAHVNLDPDTRATVPWVLDVQSRLLESLATRMVLPLVPQAAPSGLGRRTAIERLNPVLTIDGQICCAVTQALFAMPKNLLGSSVADLSQAPWEIIAALDCLLSGV
ncbi:MAG: CcdB family protein [Rhodoferax sp.]|nr:CcdB family protein [Rhodoferax sp.]